MPGTTGKYWNIAGIIKLAVDVRAAGVAVSSINSIRAKS